MNRFIQALLLAAVSLSAAVAVGQEDLPPESVLPGQQIESTQSLPPESVLPGEVPANDRSGTLSPSDAPQLPGEDQLPDIQMVQQVALPEDPPWLRLNLRGPTAPVQIVCFSRDGRRLMAGGNDKMLHSWIAAPRGVGRPQHWVYETPVRWQVQRATRGDIHAVAALEGKVAFAGIGASALTGEIVLADQTTMTPERTLFDLERGHRSQILDLAATPTGLYSLDSEGVVQFWSADPQTGLWKFAMAPAVPQVIRNSEMLRPWRLRGSRMASSDRGRLYFPVPVRIDRGVPFWRIAQWDAAQNQPGQLVPSIAHEFPGGIGAMACDADGRRLIAADISDSGNLLLADLRRNTPPQQIAIGANVRAIALSRKGTEVAAVVAKSPAGPFELRRWRWPGNGSATLQQTIPLNAVATACSFNPDGTLVAVAQQQAIEVYDVENPQTPPVRLATTIITPAKVAFTLDRNYKLAIEPASPAQPGAIVFDPTERRYSAVDAPPETVPANPWRGTWSLTQQAADQGTRLVYRVMRDKTPYCELPAEIMGNSRITSAAWLAMGEERQAPSHLLIGTAGRNHLYLLDISDPRNVRLVREFRGHSAAARSVGVSADQRYVVSGSDDGLVNLWKLTEPQPASLLQNMWGAEVEIVDAQVVLRNVVPDGPLYFRGAREGDVLRSVAQRVDAQPDRPLDPDHRQEVTLDAPEAIVEALRNSSGLRMLRFQLVRNGAAQKPFYLHPAWQPLASLVVTADREWAYWTPYGYYDASFNGHKIFGWQINQGIDREPNFFLAAELQEQLEKPRVMGRLLEAGSLPAAMQVAKAEVPFDLPNRLEALAALRPQIEIVSPAANGELTAGETLVEAIIRVPSGAELLPPKARANGIAAIELLSESEVDSETDGGRARRYRWRVPLPPDPQVRIDVVAATSDGVSASQSRTVTHHPPEDLSPPRIFVIAAGISSYADQQIPQLDFAAANARAFVATLEAHAANVEAVVLTDSQVTRPLWGVAAETLSERLNSSVRPQDVALIFLSGHGLRDVESQRYFFLTSDSRFTDVAGRRYERCLSSTALQEIFAGLPCRKVAILDTCHSGALQPLKQEDLKTMLRSLEEDVVLTITASEGDEEAFESRERQLGRFTARLIEALTGGADLPQYYGNNNGVVSLSEAAHYVQATVPQDAAAAGHSQHPTIFPKDLFPLVTIPLTTQAP